MSIASYFHLSRQEQNDNLRFGALFETFPESQIIFSLFYYHLPRAYQTICVRLGDFIFQLKMQKTELLINYDSLQAYTINSTYATLEVSL